VKLKTLHLIKALHEANMGDAPVVMGALLEYLVSHGVPAYEPHKGYGMTQIRVDLPKKWKIVAMYLGTEIAVGYINNYATGDINQVRGDERFVKIVDINDPESFPKVRAFIEEAIRIA